MSNRALTTEPEGETYFDRERTRLLQEIATGMEDLLSNTNAYNRRIEEAYGVGKDFGTVARLWRGFLDGVERVKDDDAAVPGTGGTNFGASTRR